MDLSSEGKAARSLSKVLAVAVHMCMHAWCWGSFSQSPKLDKDVKVQDARKNSHDM